MPENEPKLGLMDRLIGGIVDTLPSELRRIWEVLSGKRMDGKELPKGFMDRLSWVFSDERDREPEASPVPPPTAPSSASRPLLTSVTESSRTYSGFSIQAGSGKNVADRNNNPGNLRKHPKGVPGEKNFVRFESPEEGFKALMDNIRQRLDGSHPATLAKLGRPARTLREVMSVYAPRGDDNDPDKYASVLANKLGISTGPDEPVGNLLGRVPELAKYIAQHEGYTGKITLS